MKRSKISSIMVFFIVSLFFISLSLLPAIADPGNGKGDGNDDTDPPPPPKGPDDYKGGGNDSSGDQNQEGNNSLEDDGSGDQNQEGNDDEDDHDWEENQERNQNREGDDDNDDVDDDQERYQHRKIEMEFEENRLRIRSEWGQDDYEDEIVVTFDLEDGPTLKLEYENNMHSSENELSFEVKIIELIEYRDTNQNGRYDEEDISVNNYSFENSIFRNLTFQKQCLLYTSDLSIYT